MILEKKFCRQWGGQIFAILENFLKSDYFKVRKRQKWSNGVEEKGQIQIKLICDWDWIICCWNITNPMEDIEKNVFVYKMANF